MPLMYIRKGKEAKTDLCGTPDSTHIFAELVGNGCRCCSLVINVLCWPLSKVMCRSSSHPQVTGTIHGSHFS